jgi:hypothetical protein
MAVECGSLEWVVVLMKYGVKVEQAHLEMAQEMQWNESRDCKLILRIVQTHLKLQITN